MPQAVERRNPEESRGLFAQLRDDPTSMPATVALQIFSIVPGIAGGLGGFLLAAKLAKAKKVETKGVLIASGTVALLTILSVYLIVESGEVQEEG